MDNITWSGHEWLTKERWGRVHPDKSFCWYDPECVNVDNKGYLHLTTDKSPNEIQHYNGKTYKPNLGTGLICSVEDFSYGRFEIEAMMPRGRNKWPAFWLWGSETWPPEIDILEGYTEFCDFNPAEISLVESLRTLRILHYSAWLARRWSDPAFPHNFPWFNTERYWAEHILELREQFAALQEPALKWL